MTETRKWTWVGFAVLLGAASAWLGPSFDVNHTVLSALRVLNGQKVYVDFSIPHGPMAAWILVPFLGLAPSIGWGLMLASGALNGLASGAAWGVVAATGAGNAAARDAALLTAVWFVPVFGAYYLDHLAYALALAAFAVFLSPASAFHRGGVAGVLLAFAYHSKQTVGGPALLALVVAAAVAEGREMFRDRTLAWMSLSLVAAHVVVLGYIAATGGLSQYFLYAVQIPTAFAGDVPNEKSLWKLPQALALPFGIDPVETFVGGRRGRLLFYPVVLAFYAGYFWLARRYLASRRGEEGAKKELLAGLLVTLSTLWCTALLGRLFAHVTFGAGILVALETSRVRPWLRNGVVAFGVALGLAHVAAVRQPWVLVGQGLGDSQLSPLMMRDRVSGFDVLAVRPVIQYLRDHEGKLAALSDSAQVVPLALGQPTFEPVGHYHEGLTIPSNKRLRQLWEVQFVRNLENRDVGSFWRKGATRCGGWT